MYTFYNQCKLINPDVIGHEEQFWLDRTTMGGLIWADNSTELTTSKCYDVNFQYPNVMSKYSFPMRQGKFKRLTEFDENFIGYGIYRCIIKNTNYKLFRTNNINYYTHIDIRRAFQLGFDIELIQDDEPNALLYTGAGCKAHGSVLFKEYFNKIYELKQQRVPHAKKLLNILWGMLCSKALKIKRTFDGEINCNFNWIKRIIPLGKNEYKIEYFENNRIFEYNYARLGCFLTAISRNEISKVIEPIVQDVHRVHTDGFIVKGDVKVNIPMSDELGDWKIEKSGRCSIHNVNKIIWNKK